MKCAITILAFAVGLPAMLCIGVGGGWCAAYVSDKVGEALGLSFGTRMMIGPMIFLSLVGAGLGAALCRKGA